MAEPEKLNRCRACGNPNLELVLDLGVQMLTGVFPREVGADVTRGPLRLVKCMGAGTCGLLQLDHTYDLPDMYGDNYGYRSGLNPSMVRHLEAKVARIRSMIELRAGDLVVDIGSNDSTTLRAYGESGLDLVGVDPTGTKFRQFYPPHIALVADFFSYEAVAKRYPGKKARVVTSFSMFYDLPEPLAFMKQVRELLADDGLWVFEQSYMPTMLDMNSYDTACHEHLEYYDLSQISWMAERAGLRIADVELNDVNGGSFSLTAVPAGSSRPTSAAVEKLLASERARRLDTLAPYQAFAERVADTRAQLRAFLDRAKAEGKRVAGLGASTKGNVVLQYCGVTEADVFAIGEVNPDKFGARTPGTWIPIVSEEEVLAAEPDYLLVLPWHFWSFFERNPKLQGRTLVRPLPRVEAITIGAPR